jgi:hypothetical protein
MNSGIIDQDVEPSICLSDVISHRLGARHLSNIESGRRNVEALRDKFSRRCLAPRPIPATQQNGHAAPAELPRDLLAKPVIGASDESNAIGCHVLPL